MQKVSAIIERARRAYARGSCLQAGQLIDVAYRHVGLKRVPKALRQLDEKFERTCVKKRPS